MSTKTTPADRKLARMTKPKLSGKVGVSPKPASPKKVLYNMLKKSRRTK